MKLKYAFFIAGLFFFSLKIEAQNIRPSSEAKEKVTPFPELTEQIFGKLGNEKYPLNLLIEKTFMASKIASLNGRRKSPTIHFGDWLAVYAEVQQAHTKASGDPNLNALFLKIQNSYFEEVEEGAIRVPFGILDYRYKSLRKKAIKKNWLLIEDSLSLVHNPRTRRNPFKANRVFAACPLIDTIYHTEVVYDFSDYIFSDREGKPRQIVVDFGDGRGAQKIRLGQRHTVQYTSNGLKKIKTKIRVGRRWLRSQSSVFINVPQLQARAKAACGFTLSFDVTNFTETGINGNSISAKMKVWLGCGNNNLRKPVILVTGHNLISQLPIEAFYDKFNEQCLLEDLHQKGYDIVIVKFMNGVDHIENNARLLKQVINAVNQRKTLNGTHHENILIGYSSGALGSKMALAQMERDHLQSFSNPHHHSRIYFSYDGEHQGANIPLGVQHSLTSLSNISFLQPFSILLASRYNLFLGAPMAREFLLYHHSQTGNIFGPGQGADPLHVSLMQNFNNLSHPHINVNGYPAFTRNIGIANGSSTATNFGFNQNQVLLEINKNINLGFWQHKEHFDYRSIALNQNTLVMNRLLQTRTFFSTFFTTVVNENFITGNNGRPVDNAPGSTLGLHNSLKTAFKALLLSINPDTEVTVEDCFNPTISGLDIRNHPGNDFNYNVINNNLLFIDPNTAGLNFGYPHLQHPANHYQLTPFDAVFTTATNDKHVLDEIPEIPAFILEEVAPSTLHLQNRTIGAHTNTYRADFEAETTIRAGQQVTFKTPHNDFVVESNATVLLEAGTSIILEPGFVAKVGSDVKVAIEGCCCGQ